MHCPLCRSSDKSLFNVDGEKHYYRCNQCKLVYLDHNYHLSAESEYAEYLKHQNSPQDLGYRKFLSRIYTPLNLKLAQQSVGLDFGCGPGPTLSLMFEESGHQVNLYDKFFFPDKTVLQLQYDFVTATEVFEHLTTPSETLDIIWRCVKPGGQLGVMTKLVLGEDNFAKWHYKNDPTHVIFFSIETMQWLANYWRASFSQVAKDAFIFTR